MTTESMDYQLSVNTWSVYQERHSTNRSFRREPADYTWWVYILKYCPLCIDWLFKAPAYRDIGDIHWELGTLVKRLPSTFHNHGNAGDHFPGRGFSVFAPAGKWKVFYRRLQRCEIISGEYLFLDACVGSVRISPTQAIPVVDWF